MSKLHISATLSLPLDFVTQTQAILAIKRVGKTYTASAQVSPLSSGYEKNVSTLSARELVTYPQKGVVRCADWLFL